jgi:hypothetical protein
VVSGKVYSWSCTRFVTPSMDDIEQKRSILKSQITTFSVFCFLIALVAILFYPLLLLSLIFKCLGTGNDWNLDVVNEDIVSHTKMWFFVILIPLAIGMVIWALISGACIGLAGLGILMLIVVWLCFMVFWLVAFKILGKPYEALKAKIATVHV